MNQLDPRGQMLAIMGLSFGLRINEALSYAIRDLEGEYLEVFSSKKSENETFRIPAVVKKHLSALLRYYRRKGFPLNDKSALFISQKGPMTIRHASRLICRAAKRAGLDGQIGTHSFRKAFVMAIYEATGKDPVATLPWSRHKGLDNLLYYISSSIELELEENLPWLRDDAPCPWLAEDENPDEKEDMTHEQSI